MRAEELREMQAPLKQQYREAPAAAMITLSAEGNLDEGIVCSVETGKAIVQAGLHPATGGDGIRRMLGRYAAASPRGVCGGYPESRGDRSRH